MENEKWRMKKQERRAVFSAFSIFHFPLFERSQAGLICSPTDDTNLR
jgi:hypothetical protein